MSNVLNFVLGLEAGGFLSTVNRVGDGMKTLIGGAIGVTGFVEGISSAFDHMWEQVERGAVLKDLSARTGETVGGLFSLEAGLKAVGVGAESAGGFVNRLQRTLSGISDEGESTAEVFDQLHLYMNQLRSVNAAKAIEEIAAALGKVDRFTAAGFAQKLFGREGAGDILQIARSTDEFSAALTRSAGAAALFERDAAAFKKLAETSEQVKAGFANMWAGIAEGASPGLQKIETILAKLNFQSFGVEIGGVVNALANALEQGHFSDILGAAIKAGVEQGNNYFMASVQGWGAALEVIMKNALTPQNKGGFNPGAVNILKGINSASDASMHLAIGTIDQLGALLTTGWLNGTAKDFQNKANARAGAYDRTAAETSKYFGHTEGPITSILDGSGAAFVKGLTEALKNMPHNMADQFAAMLKHFNVGLPATVENATTPKPPPELPPIAFNLDRLNIEKMGFVFNNGGNFNPAKDAANATARNTAALVEQNAQILAHWQQLAAQRNFSLELGTR